MKYLLFLICLSFSAKILASCPLPWICEKMSLPIPYTTGLQSIKFTTAQIRAGYLPHQGQFKGNILYFEGLGDSMLNHNPLLKKISKAGFRVIAFDYMGQGGSSEKMNKTRIEYIPWIGQRVWGRFAHQTDKFQQKTIIGWSTGGLAAYYAASEYKADRIILIAPGLAPKKIVGEGLFHDLPNEISLESLTSDVYFDRSSDPHKEEIKPNSPLKVPHFSANFLLTAEKMRMKSISPSISGLVLLSGEDDTYINANKTRKIIEKNAPHFKVLSYEGALHEIDNERKEIREKAHRDILQYLNSES